ncbi:MAG: ADP-ribosylglycohydrolase family protein [Bacillus sp. (in: firmicutes)]
MKNTRYDTIQGALLGGAVGDALGVPVEFLKRHSYEPVTEMRGYGTHMQEAGTWSDDSSMTFCTAESLINGYHPADMAEKYCEWHENGYWTHNGKRPFDIGCATYKVLTSIRNGTAGNPSGEDGEHSNGNGSLMRILPLAFYLHTHKELDRFAAVEETSSITHAHIRSKIACALYIEIAIGLLNGKPLKAAYTNAQETIDRHYFENKMTDEQIVFRRLLKEDLSQEREDEIKSSGYVIDTLEAALWCLLTTGSFKEAVLKAVNLGEDTDTVGAVTGGLAGILYGGSSIPDKWIKGVKRHTDIIDLGNRYAESLS